MIVTLTYAGLADAPGVVLDGVETTTMDALGTGSTTGTVAWQMSGTKGAALAGSLGFDLLLQDGYPAGGVYEVTLDGSPYQVSWALTSDLDLTTNGILPIEVP